MSLAISPLVQSRLLKSREQINKPFSKSPGRTMAFVPEPAMSATDKVKTVVNEAAAVQATVATPKPVTTAPDGAINSGNPKLDALVNSGTVVNKGRTITGADFNLGKPISSARIVGEPEKSNLFLWIILAVVAYLVIKK